MITEGLWNRQFSDRQTDANMTQTLYVVTATNTFYHWDLEKHLFTIYLLNLCPLTSSLPPHLFALDLLWSRGLSAIKVNAFKTSCCSWQDAVQFWLYWALGFLLSWHRNLPTHFLEHLRFPPCSLFMPAVILKKSVNLTSKQGFMCLSWPQIINHM